MGEPSLKATEVVGFLVVCIFTFKSIDIFRDICIYKKRSEDSRSHILSKQDLKIKFLMPFI